MTSAPIPRRSPLVRIGWLVGAVSIAMLVHAAKPSAAIEVGVSCLFVAPLVLVAAHPKWADVAEGRHPTLVAVWLFGALAWVAVLTEQISPAVAVGAGTCLVALGYFTRKRAASA